MPGSGANQRAIQGAAKAARAPSKNSASKAAPSAGMGKRAGAPAGFIVKRKAIITTIAATVVWAVICGIILSGWISVRDLDFMGRMGPPSGGG